MSDKFLSKVIFKYDFTSSVKCSSYSCRSVWTINFCFILRHCRCLSRKIK